MRHGPEGRSVPALAVCSLTSPCCPAAGEGLKDEIQVQVGVE